MADHQLQPVFVAPVVQNLWIFWSKVLLPTCPCWRQLEHLDYREDARKVWDFILCKKTNCLCMRFIPTFMWRVTRLYFYIIHSLLLSTQAIADTCHPENV